VSPVSRQGAKICGSDCAAARPSGRHRELDVHAVFVVGLSGFIGDRWVVRGGWQSHRFGNDENMTQQVFVGVGRLFGR